MVRRFLALLCGAVLVLGGTAPVSSAELLEPGIEAATGISRTVDAGLQARAAVRAVQIQTDFGHCCLAYGEAEIIAWNSGYSDPISQLIQGWLGSPTHRAIMFDRSYDRIGCGTSYLAPRTYGVCLFADSGGSVSPPAPAPGGSTPAPAPTLAPEVIPNTAMFAD